MPSALRRAIVALLLANLSISALRAFEDETPQGLGADDALVLLVGGNRRFVSDAPVHFQQGKARRAETAKNGQKPFAVVLACADSRVPPELIFDQGLGCLFTIRVAGNVARTDEIASIEYAVGHLGTRLVVVMGHSQCGAVTAVVDELHGGPNIDQLLAPITPAVARARSESPGSTGPLLVAAAVQTNVEQAIADMQRQSTLLSLSVSAGKLRIVGAVYNIETGEVKFLDQRAPQEATTVPEPAAPPRPAAMRPNPAPDHH